MIFPLCSGLYRAKNTPFSVSQLGIYNSFGTGVHVPVTHKKGIDI